MDWLTKLLVVDTPENTTLGSAELSFRGGISPWVAIPLGIFFVGLIIFLYMIERGKLGLIRRSLLSLLRIAALALLLFLMFRPVLLAEFDGNRPRGVALLLDNSQSMLQNDRRMTDADLLRVAIAEGTVAPTTSITDAAALAKTRENTSKQIARVQLVKAVLANDQLKLIPALQEHGPLRPFLFGQRLFNAIPEAALPKDAKAVTTLIESLKADQPRTALADAIYEILQRKDGDLPAGLVVMTDGLDNASKFTLVEAAEECKRLGVPLFLYGVGTADGGSVQLREVAAPDTLFYDDKVTVPIRYRAQGFKTGRFEIALTLNGKVMAKKEVDVQSGEDLREVLTFTPEKKDLEAFLDRTKDRPKLETTIRLKGSADYKDSLSREVRLVDTKIRVLVVESSPRFEYKFLQPMLLRDRRVDANFLLINADPKVSGGGLPFLASFPPATGEEALEGKYDLVVLGDVPASYLGKDNMESLQKFVRGGGGLIVIAGRNNMPSGYEKSPLEEVLPVEFKAVKFPVEADIRTQEYPPTLSDAGQRSGMLSLADSPEESLKIWQSLPGFFWNYPVVKLRPGATSLVVNPRAKLDKQGMPILATQHYGRGHVLFLATDEIWRWRYNVQDKHYNRFWGQVIYEMGLPHLLGGSAKRAQFALEHSEAVLEKPGSVFLRLVDKSFVPRTDKQVEAKLEHLDAKPGEQRFRTVTLQGVPNREGEYRALLPHDRPGRFELTVNNPEPTTFQYRVEKPAGHELEEQVLAEGALREAARVSGGKFYREEDLHRLASDIPTRTASFSRRQDVILWNPLAMILFVGLVSAEWLVRKFSNLS